MTVGFVVGGILGYIITRKSSSPDGDVTAVQLLSILTLFGYLFLSFIFDREVSWIIAVAVLATGYGLKGGEILEKIIERRNK